MANQSTCTIPQSVASNGWHVWLLRLKSSQLEFVCCRVHKLALGESHRRSARVNVMGHMFHIYIYIRHLVRDIEVACGCGHTWMIYLMQPRQNGNTLCMYIMCFVFKHDCLLWLRVQAMGPIQYWFVQTGLDMNA